MSQAADGTCQGALTHEPRYAEVDKHHVHPTYLCALLGVPKETRTVNLCSGCHDLVHHVIRHLVNNGTVGNHHLPYGLRVIVYDFWTWWQTTLKEVTPHA